MSSRFQLFFFSCDKAIRKKKLTHCHLVKYLKRQHINTVAHQAGHFKAAEKCCVAEEGSEQESRLPRGSRQHGRLGDDRRGNKHRKRLLKNKPSALPFFSWFGPNTTVNSSARQDPCQLNERRFGLMQVTWLYCLQCSKQKTTMFPK